MCLPPPTPQETLGHRHVSLAMLEVEQLFHTLRSCCVFQRSESRITLWRTGKLSRQCEILRLLFLSLQKIGQRKSACHSSMQFKMFENSDRSPSLKGCSVARMSFSKLRSNLTYHVEIPKFTAFFGRSFDYIFIWNKWSGHVVLRPADPQAISDETVVKNAYWYRPFFFCRKRTAISRSFQLLNLSLHWNQRRQKTLRRNPLSHKSGWIVARFVHWHVCGKFVNFLSFLVPSAKFAWHLDGGWPR